jgi:outer membrane protein assembly factor BamB
VVAGDLVFVGACSGRFIALDRQTGKLRWSYDTKQDGEAAQFHGDPVVTDQYVVTGSDRTTLSYTYAFTRETGQLLWKRGNSTFESDLLRLEGAVIGRRWNGDLLSIALEDGETLWTVRPRDYLYRFHLDDSPVECGGVVYFGGVDGLLYAVAGLEGTVLWHCDLGTRITTTPVTDGSDLYLGLATDKIVRLTAAGGKVTAEIACQARPHGRPVLAKDAVIMLLGEATLAAFDRDLLQMRWSREAARSWSSHQPLLWNDIVIVGTPSGRLMGFRGSDGAEALSLTVEGRIRGLGAAGDVIYIGTMEGMLYAYRPEKSAPH